MNKLQVVYSITICIKQLDQVKYMTIIIQLGKRNLVIGMYSQYIQKTCHGKLTFVLKLNK